MKLGELVHKLHNKGLSQVAAVLNLFLSYATEQQQRAMMNAIEEWWYENCT